MGDLQRIQPIFAEALEKEGAERRTYLDRVCGSDTALRRELETLLCAHESAGGFLESPVLETDVHIDEIPVCEAPGTVIGRYKLLERIGEGGMAVVYMAEQQRPIRRKVALKIIKLGMDTKQVIARFEAERQALAMMDHPSIAKVLDAGTTETGRPYFVMELVQGISITEYCDRNSLSTRDRLALFIQVCSAVQHAHQKGIIHRDIKPSNVLVTHHDGRAVPKVIDFGIAKATNQKLTEKTLFTRYAHLIGTPAYMSPEQAELSDLDVDTRSDIYSLGVLLYELLTGSPPFSEEELRRAGYIEMQRVIREQEPLKPSTKLTTLGATLTDIARYRNSTPDLLRKAVRGDLDWIVMKALEKDRSRRYETASGLAEEARRHLESEPVLARGPSATYRLQKFLHRNRVQAIAVLAVALVIAAVGIILSMWNQDRARLAEGEFFRHRNILSQARESHAKGQHAEAVEQLSAVIRSQDVGAEAQLLYAGILVEGRQPEEAVTMLQQLLDDRPEIAGAAHSLLARILWEIPALDAEQLKKVQDHRARAEALLPETAEAYFLRAMTAMTIRQKFELLDHALHLDRGHFESRRLRALTYYASRRYEAMERDAFVMTALRPQDPLGYSLRAAALHRIGEHEAAVSDYDIAISFTDKADPQYVDLTSQRCDALLAMGQYERAIAEARECLAVTPDAMALEFRAFCALTALGRYEEAAELVERVGASGPQEAGRFTAWSRKYVFDCLGAGQSWHSPKNEPAGLSFQPMLDAERTYRVLSTKARRVLTDAFTARWSPDGGKLAFSRGFHGYSGVAVWDAETGQTDLLIVPGKDPVWSPDGQYLAFVRDCAALPLSELVGAERANRHRGREAEEVWIMRADGTEPRRLASGNWPRWGSDPNHIYFYCQQDGALCEMSIEDSESQRRQMIGCTDRLPEISPDQKYVACSEGTSVKILDLATGSPVADVTLPFGPQGKTWSFDGRELCIGAYGAGEATSGLWVHDLDSGQTRRVLEGPVRPISLAPDGSNLLCNLAPPYFEIWAADLDPNTRIVESLGPGHTILEHYGQQVAQYTERIDAEPNNARNYYLRAQCHDSLGDRASANADMRRWSAVIRGEMPPDDPDAMSQDRCWVIDMPFNCELVFSAERHVNEMPMMSVAFGQKGRSGMKLFKIPMFATSLSALGLIFGLCAQPAQADYEFGVAERLGPPINSANPSDYEWWPRLHADGLSLIVLRGLTESQEVWKFTRSSKQDPWNSAIQIDVGDTSELGAGGPASFMPGVMTMDGLECYGLWYISPEGYGHVDLYFRERDTINSPWSERLNVGPPVNTAYSEAHSVISPDGLELFFSDYELHRPGGYGEEDLWVTRRATRLSPWGTPENLGPVVNSPANDSRAHISMDGLLLFFDSRRPGGYGGSDLYVTRRKTLSDPWEHPVNLGQNVNSSGDEFGPGISPDGRELYFVRNQDIWCARINPTVDFNGDGAVDGGEVLAITASWGLEDSLCDIGPTPFGDGIVDLQDVMALAGYVGQEMPDPTLLAHWPLDATEGMIASDAAGDYDGTILGPPIPAWQFEGGQVDGALEFDGATCIIADHVLNPSDGPFSVLAWVQGGQPGQAIVAQRGGSNWLALDATAGTLMTELTGGSRSGGPLYSEAVVADGSWHRVAFVWDGSHRRLYVDSVLVAEDTNDTLAASTGGLQIGCGKNMETGSFWSGLIDDVRIYNRIVRP